MIAALVLMAAQAQAVATGPILLDLAAIPAGPVHRIAVTGERPFTAELVNRLPGAAYRVVQTLQGGGGSSVGLNPSRPDDLPLRSWRDTKGCEDVVSRVGGLIAATEEAQVGALLAIGSPLQAALAHCPGADQLRGGLLRVTGGHAVQASGLAMGRWLDLRVERTASASTTAKTWSIRFEATSEPSFGWAHPNELSWLAFEIASDLAEMAGFARGKTPPTPKVEIEADTTAARVSLGGELPAFTIALDDSVWSAAAWEPVARAALGGAPRPPSSPPSEAPVPDALTDPQPRVLERENRRISDWLAHDMLSAEAHEQAALLLAAVALRESAGIFSDTRLGLCRLTAHLAMARALRTGSPTGPSGTLAEVARLALIGRQLDAVTTLDRAEAKTPTERAWGHALRLRATADWRILAAPLTASLLERREHYRALERSLGDDPAVEFLRRRNTEALPDWGRIVLAGSPSVETGNRFAPILLAMELAEAAALHRESQGSELAAADLVARLNESPGRCIRRDRDGGTGPRVVDWGSWASAARRHILHAVASADRHAFRSLGLSEEADEAWRQAQASLEGLELLSLVEMRMAALRGRSGSVRHGPPAADDGCDRVTRVVETHPERISAASWALLKRGCDRAAEATRLAGERRWFGSTLPPGTAFDAAARRGFVGSFGLAELEGILRIAPWERDAADAYYLRRRKGGRGTMDDVQAAYGRLLDYDVKAMEARATVVSDDPDRYRAAFTKIAELDPNRWLDLGTYLAGRGLDQEASSAFQSAVDHALDRVAVANQSGWLVDYYLDGGERERASAVARGAGATGSWEGMAVLAQFLERTGQCAGAESRLRARAERYPTPTHEDVQCFYARCADDSGDPRFRPEARDARARTLGFGGEPVTPASFSGRPNQGVIVIESAPRFEAQGLVRGAILVAIDGQRVRDFAHYRCLRTLGAGPEATVIVWRDGTFVEIRGPLRRPHPALSFRTVSGSP